MKGYGILVDANNLNTFHTTLKIWFKNVWDMDEAYGNINENHVMLEEKLVELSTQGRSIGAFWK